MEKQKTPEIVSGVYETKEIKISDLILKGNYE